MSGTHTLVLGAGFGGLTAATELARLLPDGHRVTLVDRREKYVMGATKLWMLDGRRAPGEGARSIRDVERHGVEFVRGDVTAIDVAGRTARVGDAVLAWDHLVVALGAETAPAAVPGLPGHGHDLYSLEGVQALHRDLAAFPGGDVLVLVTALPFKCPPAPYEAGMLMQEFLDGRGVDARVTVASPEPHPLPVGGAACGDAVRGWAADRGVDILSGRKATEVREGVVRFEDGSEQRFDLLAAVPPHRAPAVLREAGLLNDAGWVFADPGTLATRFPNVWAVGDCNVVPLANGKPLVKAGIMAEGEARVVAENLAARVRGEPESARFDGKGHCYLEIGGGLATEVKGDFFATPAPILVAGTPTEKALEGKRRFESERLERWFGA